MPWCDPGDTTRAPLCVQATRQAYSPPGDTRQHPDPDPRTHTPCSSHVVARLLLRDVTDEKSGTARWTEDVTDPPTCFVLDTWSAALDWTHSRPPSSRQPSVEKALSLSDEATSPDGLETFPLVPLLPLAPCPSKCGVHCTLSSMGVTSACVPNRPPSSTEGDTETTQDATRSAAPGPGPPHRSSSRRENRPTRM